MKTFSLILLLLPLALYSQPRYPYKNLVLEGGGARGVAYAGAVEVLEQENILKNIDRVAGSSAGAIAGLIISLGYNSVEIDSILQALKIGQFNDGRDIFGKIKRVRKEYGIYKGDKLEKWLGELIYKKTGDANTTFLQLHQLHGKDHAFKDFYCTGTNITKQELEILSWEKWPGMKLKTAVHISGCIPFYFKPVPIDSAGREIPIKDTSSGYDLYVDGGMLCNYPVNIFDSCTDGGNPLISPHVIYNYQTLGLKLERAGQVEEFEKDKTEIAPYQVKNMKQYLYAVMNLMMEKLNRQTPDLSNEMGRTIYISYGDISGKPRNLSLEEKKLLHDNGVTAAREFFSRLSASF